ncbi:MAG TPA: GatB/YqeY domain-containing protein [Gemmatimonadales bacterium]
MPDTTSAPSALSRTLQDAMNAARKSQDKDRTLVLGTIIANLKNRRIELRREPTDDEVVDVLRKGIKLRREAAEQYEKAARPELAAVEQAQIRVLEEFLPPAVDPEEIRRDVRSAIAAGATDIGKVMAAVLPKFKGRADGKVINGIVREELQKG